MRYCLLFVMLLINSLVEAQLPQPSTGMVRRIPHFKSDYVDARNVDVWLPEDYSPAKQYAVLYMHDGQMLYDSATTWNKQEWGVDETISSLMNAGKIQPCIVVGVWNSDKNRHIDYFPQAPFESLSKQQQDSLLNANRPQGASVFSGKVQSDKYLKFLVKELKPYIDKHFATNPDMAHTFVAGSSMGGLISFYAVCEYPKVFGGAACLSTHWPGTFDVRNNPIPDAFLEYLRKNLPNPEKHRFYFDYGTATLDALYEPFQLKADAIMKEAGYSAENWITKKFEGADHSERAWKQRFEIPVQFLLGKK